MSPGQRASRKIAKGAGLGRESLYKALSAGAHPRYETVSAILRALGVKLAYRRLEPPHGTARRKHSASRACTPVRARRAGLRYRNCHRAIRACTAESRTHDMPQDIHVTRDYSVVVERDEDGWYVASVPTLPGCHTQARSLDELMIRIREAIEACLEAGEHSDTTGIYRRSTRVNRSMTHVPAVRAGNADMSCRFERSRSLDRAHPARS